MKTYNVTIRAVAEVVVQAANVDEAIEHVLQAIDLGMMTGYDSAAVELKTSDDIQTALKDCNANPRDAPKSRKRPENRSDSHP